MAGDPLSRSDQQPGGIATAPPPGDRAVPLLGAYSESPAATHQTNRTRLLERLEWLPEPPTMVRIEALADDPASAVPRARVGLVETGLVRIVFDQPLSTGDLIRFARELGEPIGQPGTHALQQYMEEDLVLNLRQDVGPTDPEDPKKLVSTNPINLHSELSTRPLSLQPRFVLLHGVEVPPHGSGGQTLLVPMAEVHAALSFRQQRILRGVKVRDFPDAPPVLRDEGDLPVVNFYDWAVEALAWQYAGDEDGVSTDEVNAALTTMLDAMHDPVIVGGVDWTPGSVLVWDNWRYFHGRTHVRDTGRRRHLQRMYLQLRAPESRVPRGKEE